MNRQAQANDRGEVLEAAQLLAARRPIPAETLRTLAIAQISAGLTDAGLHTIQIAGQRGWRDPATQSAMLQIAISSGDESEAARRFAALLIQLGIDDAQLADVATALFVQPDGASAAELAEVIAGTERWQDTFLRRGARIFPEESLVWIFNTASCKGAKFDCQALLAVVRRKLAASLEASKTLNQIARQQCNIESALDA